jgi:ATP-binding cassette, subfamily B, bacterial
MFLDNIYAFIWKYLKQKKWCLFGFLIVAVSWSIEMALSPYLLKVIIDTVVKYQDPLISNNMINAVLIPVILYIGMNIFVSFHMRLYEYINLTLYPYMRSAIAKDMFNYLIDNSYSFFQNNFSGSITQQIFHMINNIEIIVKTFNEDFYPRIFALLISSAMLFIAAHPIFGLIMLVWGISFVGLSYITSKPLNNLSQQVSDSMSRFSGAISDSISNVMNTKLFTNIDYEIINLDQTINELTNKDRALLWYNFKINFFQGISITIFISSMLIALIYTRSKHLITVGDFSLVLGVSVSFLWSVYNIGRHMQQFSKSLGICKYVLKFIVDPNKIIDVPNAQPIVISKGEIKFKNVSFSFKNNKNLFNNFNITIKQNEKIGLVGYSGGGKSTFIKLILRLMDLKSGNILIDAQDIKLVSKHSLREQITVIPQDPELFHRSIIDNIRFAKINASEEEIIDVAKKTDCHDFIINLPDGYQSMVGERGVKLSGGQKQRIAMARAFLKNSPILLMDEATSALDSATEQYIQHNLFKIMDTKTTVVVAHRLSTLKSMDRIIFLKNGEIIEDGSLSELLANTNGHFYKLWKMQSDGFLSSPSM